MSLVHRPRLVGVCVLIFLGGLLLKRRASGYPEYPPEVTVQFKSAEFSGNENAGTVDITVTLSQQAGEEIKVKYATSDGTATAGKD